MMTWEETKAALAKIWLINFESQEHFEEWRKWDNDDLLLEKKIKNILSEN